MVGDAEVMVGSELRFDAPLKGIIVLENQGGFAADAGASAQGRDDLAVLTRFVAGLELAANDTGLAPDLSRRELAVGGQAGQFGAGAGAAGRAVVGLAGAEHEVAAVGLLVGA